MKPLVIYHDNCADGFGAAFAAWLKLGDEAEYLPMQYGAEAQLQLLALRPSLEARDVYILDFSFEKPVMEQVFSCAKRVVWLDHHKTAFEMWVGEIPEGGSWYEDANFMRGQHVICLDSNKSGALLAWEFFHPGTKVPLLFQHIDDRDRWQFKLKGSKEVNAYLMSVKPWKFQDWQNSILGTEYIRTYYQGDAILRAQKAIVRALVKKAQKCELFYQSDLNMVSARDGLAVNSPTYQSEIGHELVNVSGTFGLVWFWNAEEHKVNCSLRSNGDYDVSAIAKAFGGGGHKNAAGFSCSMDQLIGWLR